MSARTIYERPVRPLGRRSFNKRKRIADRCNAAEAKGVARRALAKFLVEAEGTFDEKYAALEAKMASPDSGLVGPLPSARTARRLLKRAQHHGVDKADLFCDANRTGRPPKELDTALARKIRHHLLSDHTIDEAWELAKDEQPAVSRHQVYRIYSEIPLVERSSARHGSRAARFDALPHAAVPADRPHDVHTLDEVQLPVMLRHYDEEHGRQILYPWAVLNEDNFSRAIVGRHVINPLRRGSPAPNNEDVLSTLLMTAFQEISPDCTRAFAGHIPRVLRWDRAGAHRTLADRLTKGIGIQIPELPGDSPTNRGIVEKLNALVKALCKRIRGYQDGWAVAELQTEDPRDQRTKTAARSNERLRVKKSVAWEDLLTFEEFLVKFDEQILKYNMKRLHRALGDRTPYAEYQRVYRSQDARSGRDMLSVIPWTVREVTGAGIPHNRVNYAWAYGDDVLLRGQEVRLKADPAGGWIYTDAFGPGVFLPTMAEWVRSTPAEWVARKQAHIVKMYREATREMQEAERLELLGAEAVKRADEAIKKATRKRSSTKRSKKKDPDQTGFDFGAAPVTLPSKAPAPAATSRPRLAVPTEIGSVPRDSALASRTVLVPEAVAVAVAAAAGGTPPPAPSSRDTALPLGVVTDPRSLIRVIR